MIRATVQIIEDDKILYQRRIESYSHEDIEALSGEIDCLIEDSEGVE